MKNIIFTLFALLVSGCAPFKTYNPEQMEVKSLASLEQIERGFFSNTSELFVVFWRIYDADGKLIAERGFLRGINDKVQLVPGTYDIVMECTNTGGVTAGVYNFHRIRVDFEEGKKYLAYCLMKTEKGTLGFSMIKAMAGFISEESAYEEERKRYQLIVDNIDTSSKKEP